MAKELWVTMPDGSVWAVPALLVAEPRAAYYAGHDAGKTSGEAYEASRLAEVQVGLVDADELIDWAHNNMNWSDVAGAAKMVKGPRSVDFQEGWLNGEMELVGREGE